MSDRKSFLDTIEELWLVMERFTKEQGLDLKGVYMITKDGDVNLKRPQFYLKDNCLIRASLGNVVLVGR